MKIIWLGTLCALYLFFMTTRPAKAPAPRILDAVVEAPVQADSKAEEKSEAKAEVAVVETNPVDIEKGKEIYLSACIKCHNKDPNVKGPIGPELVDAPLEVMQHKVVTGRYPDKLPEGFEPKRKTKQMTKFPQYAKDVPSIHAYVQSLKKK